MKINLKKKLAPYTINDDEYLKAQGKLLKSIIYPEDDDCELGNNAEPIKDYPDDRDGSDEIRDAQIDWEYTHKDEFLDKHQQGY